MGQLTYDGDELPADYWLHVTTKEDRPARACQHYALTLTVNPSLPKYCKHFNSIFVSAKTF